MTRTTVLIAIAAVLTCVGCKPKATPLPAPGQKEPAPPVVGVRSFACSEVRLAIRPNSSRAALMGVGRLETEFELDPAANEETSFVLKATANGFSVTSSGGHMTRDYTDLSDLALMTPPICLNNMLVLGTCLSRDGAPRTIRLSMRGPSHVVKFELPPIDVTPLDFLAYKLHYLPPVCDMRDALAKIRERDHRRPYSLSVPDRKPQGRSYRTGAFWATTMWPANASEFTAYTMTIATPDDPINIWQVFLVDPATEEVFLIRDRSTGDLIPLGEWLALEKKTCIYSLEEALGGVVQNYQTTLLERDRKLHDRREQDGAEDGAR